MKSLRTKTDNLLCFCPVFCNQMRMFSFSCKLLKPSMLKYLSVATGMMLLFAASCKKADNDLSRQEEMRGGKWKISAGTVRLDPYVGLDTVYLYKDYLALIGQSCKEDDYLEFQANYDGLQYSGSTKCSTFEPDNVSFRWQLFDDDNGIYFLNANETFFAQTTVKAPFVTYGVGRFTIRYARYLQSSFDNTKFDTLTYTQTFSKF